jgi:hypothetical protein
MNYFTLTSAIRFTVYTGEQLAFSCFGNTYATSRAVEDGFCVCRLYPRPRLHVRERDGPGDLRVLHSAQQVHCQQPDDHQAEHFV